MPVQDRRLPFDVLPTSEARKCLAQASRHFRECGAKAEPLFFGPHRRATGVILSYERYTEMLDALDDLYAALEVRRRDRTDTGERLSYEDLARSVGFDPDEIEEPEQFEE